MFQNVISLINPILPGPTLSRACHGKQGGEDPAPSLLSEQGHVHGLPLPTVLAYSVRQTIATTQDLNFGGLLERSSLLKQ